MAILAEMTANEAQAKRRQSRVNPEVVVVVVVVVELRRGGEGLV